VVAHRGGAPAQEQVGKFPVAVGHEFRPSDERIRMNPAHGWKATAIQRHPDFDCPEIFLQLSRELQLCYFHLLLIGPNVPSIYRCQ
jgi:hypothetical protein